MMVRIHLGNGTNEQKWLYKEGEELEICQSWPSSCGVRISLADWIDKEDTGEKLKDFGAEENLDEKEEEEDAKESFGRKRGSVSCQ